MRSDKKKLIATLLILLLLMIIIFRIIIFISPDGSKDDEENDKEPRGIDKIKIIGKNHSIYNGTEPRIIAERFANALGEQPIISSKIESCCGNTKHMKYTMQNDNHLTIIVIQMKNNKEIVEALELRQSAYHERNESYGEEYAKTKVLEFATEFLLEFGINLADNYEISVIPWGYDNGSWKVTIHQLYNGEIIKGSGFVARLNRENGEIRTMDIYDWLDPLCPVYENLTVSDGRTQIYEELNASGFNFTVPYHDEYYDKENDTHVVTSWDENHIILINQSDIKWDGYSFCYGRLGYNYEINLNINETKECRYQYIINIEDGKKLFWSSKSENGGPETFYFNNLI